jgi:hypothetical protein
MSVLRTLCRRGGRGPSEQMSLTLVGVNYILAR